MIASLTPILNISKLQVFLELDEKKEKLIITLCPKMLSEKLDEDDHKALSRPVTKSYKLAEFDDEKFFNDLMDYQNSIIEADQDLNELADELKKHVADKKAKAKPKAHTNPKPKKKTQAEQREELREKQAKAKEAEPEQGDLFSGNRLSAEEEAEDIATKADEKKPLKTAAEKVEEKTEDDPLAGL